MYQVKITWSWVDEKGTRHLSTSDAAWHTLLDRIAARGVGVVDFAKSTGEAGVIVTTATQRGPAGAFGIHSLACDYGAIAVVV